MSILRKVTCLAMFGLAVCDTLILSAAETRVVPGSVVVYEGFPVAARLYIEGPPGTFHFAKSVAPNGTAVIYDVKRSETCREQHVTLSPGPFEVELPPGEYVFRAERGPEYLPVVERVTVPVEGEVKRVILQLQRWIDMPSRGWYSGDTHLHRPLADCSNLVDAEDLHVALPLTYWVRGAYEAPNLAPVGEHPPAELIELATDGFLQTPPTQRFIWPVNTEYELFTVNGRPHTQGAVLVLNHKTPLKPGAPPVGPLSQAARDEGAIFDLDKHTWNWTPMIVPVMQADLFELANNPIWRTEFLNKGWTADVLPQDWEIETDSQGYTERGWIDWGFKTYYAYLNCGFRLRPTGGTGSGFHPVPAGFGRVYVQCPDEFTYEKWMEGLNAGRSFVSTGPMLEVTINGQPPGTVFNDFSDGEIHVVVNCFVPSSRRYKVEVIVNGQVVSCCDSTQSRSTFGSQISGSTFHITRSSWVAVRCFEYRDHESLTKENRDVTEPTEKSRFRYAHTAPVYFEMDGPIKPRQREVNYFIQRMKQEIARNTGVLTEDEVAEYRKALEIYQKIAERAVE